MEYGYARVSTKNQSIDRQKTNILKDYPNAVIYSESYTGTTVDRPELKKLIKKLKKGDTVIFDEVSRMSRNADEGWSLYQDLYQKGISLVFLKEPHCNTAKYQQTLREQIKITGSEGDGVLKVCEDFINSLLLEIAKKDIYLAFAQAQKERDYLSQRTKEGMRAAHASEKIAKIQSGASYTTRKSEELKPKILKMAKAFGGTFTDTEAIEMLKIARNTYYKYKRELLQEKSL